jgi:hypothetical protein
LQGLVIVELPADFVDSSDVLKGLTSQVKAQLKQHLRIQAQEQVGPDFDHQLQASTTDLLRHTSGAWHARHDARV